MLISLLSGALAWMGSALLLSAFRWFQPRRLVERLGPYLPAGHPLRTEPRSPAPPGAGGWLAVVSALGAPTGAAVAGWLARTGLVREDAAARLERIHAPDDAPAFRSRQMGWAIAALGAAAGLCLWWKPTPPIALLVLAASPVAAFAALEHRLSRASAAWQRRVVAELPVVGEQLGMLLRSGCSLGAALERLARGRGRCSRDLARVCGRVRQGVGIEAALQEWGHGVDTQEVRDLVGVLRLEREAGDVGRLVSEEARLLRESAHRRLVESAERKAQQVWVPVTVAALVPGVIFLAVPFAAALDAFGGRG